MAPPLKLTPAVAASIIASLKAGVHKLHAAHRAGVSIDAVDNWLKRGDGPSPTEPYASFTRDVRKAEAEHAASMQGSVTRGAKQDWRAAAWDLECRFPKIYGRQATVKITVEEHLQRFLDAAERILSAEDFDRLLSEASRIGADPEAG
jgi:hypothetical protein